MANTHYLGALDIDSERDEIVEVLSRVDSDKVRPFLRITRAAEYGKTYIRMCNSPKLIDKIVSDLATWRMSKQWD